MDGNELIALARRTYVEQFVLFVRNLYGKYPRGAAEVATTRTTATPLLGTHYRIDFVNPAEGPGSDPTVIELVPDTRVEFDPIEGKAGAAHVRMEKLTWDDVAISHDLSTDPAPLLHAWFDHWYDPEDKRIAADPERLPDVIHSVGIYPGQLVIDFGTASTDAFWSLIALLRDAGAKHLVITETRDEPPEAATPSTG